ncbi:MAG: T9SS type A sorting domain-containing protein [Flavobacteriales bacterium]|nr:T9SS type A sorting domain-containing protein [Flavobacteriales bacterium]
MYRSFLSAGLLAITLRVGAQSYVHQVLVLSEGYFDVGANEQVLPPTLGSYDPTTGTYQTVATLAGPRFASDVIVANGSIYVAADDRVYRFDADTYEQLAMAEVAGVRKLAVWNDLLLITRGELGGLPHYFEARDRNGLAFVQAITPADGLLFSVEGLLVVDDKAYLAVSNAFDFANLQGRVGIVDLPSMTYASEVDLGAEGLNPERIMAHDGDVIAFNNKDFTGSSISRVNVAQANLAYTTNVSVNSGCAASVRVASNNKVYFMEYAQNELARFDLNTATVSDTLAGSPAVYGMIEDPINNVLYATTTDYFSSGDLHVMSLEGAVLSTVATSVSPGNMALDIRTTTGISTRTANRIGLYPNPATDRITVSGALPSGNSVISVTNALGAEVLRLQRNVSTQGATLDISSLSTGVYSLRLNNGEAVHFIKP